MPVLEAIAERWNEPLSRLGLYTPQSGVLCVTPLLKYLEGERRQVIS